MQMNQVKDFMINVLLWLFSLNSKNFEVFDLGTAKISAIDIYQLKQLKERQIMVCASSTDISSTGGGKVDDPKQKVFEYWDYINGLTERRFPNDKNLQLEASQYVLDALVAEDYKKVRACRSHNFKAFLTTVSLNLLAEFWNNQFGRERPNTWLKRQKDPIYQIAYQLLVKNRYSKRETIEILVVNEPERERWKLEEVVREVLTNCPIKEEIKGVSLDDNEAEDVADHYASLEEQFEEENRQALLEVLLGILNGDTNDNDEMALAIKELLVHFGKSARLTEEECLVLQLRFSSGLTLEKISQLLGLTKSQTDKHIKKIQVRLRKALTQLGFVEN